MDQGLLDASVIFGKPADLHEISIIKPEMLSLLSKIEVKIRESDVNDRVFEILNTLAVEYRPLIRSDLDILATFVKVITELLKTNLPEQGRKWALRVLRWLLVIDPEAADIEELKKCFLMAVPSKTFYLKQLEFGLQQLNEKALFFISVRDDKLLSRLLEGFGGYFRIAPALLGKQITAATESILDMMIAASALNCLPDEFVSDLVIESSSFYYKALDPKFKQELCKVFIDVFEFEVINLPRENNSELRQNWFISWLAKDLDRFKQFCELLPQFPDLFLDQVREEVVQIGRLNGYHSLSSYRNCYT